MANFDINEVVIVANPKSPSYRSVGTIVRIKGNRATVDSSTHKNYGFHFTVHLSSIERYSEAPVRDSLYLKTQKKYYLIIPNNPEFTPSECGWAGEYSKDEKPECGEMIYDVYNTRKDAREVAIEWYGMYRGESCFRISRVDDTYAGEDAEI
jgi:hypothetical protein